MGGRQVNLKIIDIELRIAAIEKVPEEYAPCNNLIFFYYHQRDWIVFNLKHPDHEIFLDKVKIYLTLDNQQKKEMHEKVLHSSVLPSIKVLDNILRIRRRIYK